MGRLNEYSVVGRKLPTETDASPKLYRMSLFAPNPTVAKSRFWYFLKKSAKVKKTSGEIVGVKQVCQIIGRGRGSQNYAGRLGSNMYTVKVQLILIIYQVCVGYEIYEYLICQ